ncbi:hypothetical protein C0993_012018 [Termitomyces sp. T159_Od127]|nr:hypothetical protein C0993_012018 [Termitomyces sp. T159_Od127]
MPNSTIVYNDAERGDAQGDIHMQNMQIGNPTYYGPIPVYEDLYLEQMEASTTPEQEDFYLEHVEGGTTPKQPSVPRPGPWNLCQHVPLTPLGSNTLEGCNFARRRAEMVASPSQRTTISTQEFLNGLNDEVIASLACDCSSDFSSLETSPQTAPTATAPTACNETINAVEDQNTPSTGLVEQDSASVKGQKVTFHSRLEEFYAAGEFDNLVPPPSPNTGATSKAPCTATPPVERESAPVQGKNTMSHLLFEDLYVADEPNELPNLGSEAQCTNTQTPMPSSSDTSNPFIHEPAITPASKHFASQQTTPEGRLSNADLHQCEESFAMIQEIFLELSCLLSQPVSQIKKWFYSGLKGSRNKNSWNLYQAYFPKHREDELQRCGLEDGTDGTDSDCWPSFQEKWGNSTKAMLQAALDLDCVVTKKETLQQRARLFQKHCTKLEKLNQEGIEHRFQTITVTFVTNRLKLDDATILGLVKCEA